MSQGGISPSKSGRSTFVTVVAWVFIAFAGFATFISLLQAVMFTFVFPADNHFFAPPAGKDPGLQVMPSVLRFMMEHMQWFFVAFWLLSAVTLVSAIGLLRRKNWARLVFVGLMLLGIVWNLGGLWLQQQMFTGFATIPSNAPPNVASDIESTMTVMRIATGAFVIVLSLVFAWIVKRLMSGSIMAEFKPLEGTAHSLLER